MKNERQPWLRFNFSNLHNPSAKAKGDLMRDALILNAILIVALVFISVHSDTHRSRCLMTAGCLGLLLVMPLLQFLIRYEENRISNLKEEAGEVFEELGLTTTEAIRMFLAQVRLKRGMPFPVTLPADNDDLLVSGPMRQSALDSVYDD
jgi:DNA-damage-inducible protein J